MKRLTKSQSLH